MKKNKQELYQSLFVLVFIVLLGALLRFTNLNWDGGHHLHPDERFLNMVVNDLDLPENWREYFNPKQSPLNPRNHQRDFFVYGNWPITISKYSSVFFNRQGLGEIALSGRQLSAVADTLTIIFVFLTAYLVEKKVGQKSNLVNKNTKIWAALIYALLVLPIQQSHFFTTDTFLNLFCTSSIFFVLSFLFAKIPKKNKNKIINSVIKYYLPLVLGAILFGFALGSKISAILFSPLLFGLIFLKSYVEVERNKKKAVDRFFANSLIFALVAYLSLRLASPYMFASSNILHPALEPAFLQNLKQLKSWEGNDVWFPPAIQWINRPVTFGLVNMAFFGMGLAAFTFMIWGLFKQFIFIKNNLKVARSKIKTNNNKFALASLLLVGWLMTFVVYYSLQFVTSVRYFLPVYPFFAIIAAFAITSLLIKINNQKIFSALIIASLLLWPMMFINIYLQPHSRVKASHWIYRNINPDAIILVEHWDDALPLHLSEYQGRYETTQLPVFGADTDEKWTEMNQLLSSADYYILTSNRAWGSIGRVPEKYPLMSKFYQDLFDGKTSYKLVAKFSSYPSLEYLGLPIIFNDSWADEAFTVYDHPEVHIFMNTK